MEKGEAQARSPTHRSKLPCDRTGRPQTQRWRCHPSTCFATRPRWGRASNPFDPALQIAGRISSVIVPCNVASKLNRDPNRRPRKVILVVTQTKAQMRLKKRKLILETLIAETTERQRSRYTGTNTLNSERDAHTLTAEVTHRTTIWRATSEDAGEVTLAFFEIAIPKSCET